LSDQVGRLPQHSCAKSRRAQHHLGQDGECCCLPIRRFRWSARPVQ